jgi:hypothetical protein
MMVGTNLDQQSWPTPTASLLSAHRYPPPADPPSVLRRFRDDTMGTRPSTAIVTLAGPS